MAKPTVRFSQEKFDEICELLAAGSNLRQIERMAEMPSANSILEWKERTPELNSQYTRARESGYTLMADDIVAISDEPVIDNDHLTRNRQRVDSRKWLLSKCLPKIYGDKQHVEGKFTVDWAQVCQEAADKWKKEEGG